MAVEYRMPNTLGENIRTVLTVLVYLLVHVRLTGAGAVDLGATLWQFLEATPFVASLTVAVALLIKTLAGDRWPPWDRILRIFCTIGICWGFFSGIYEYAGRGQLQG